MEYLTTQEVVGSLNTKRPQLIIVEGAQGAGKSHITDEIREQFPHTQLLRLSGCRKRADQTIIDLYDNLFNMLDDMAKAQIDINFVFDRMFFSEWCFRHMNKGDAPNLFSFEAARFATRLRDLSSYFDVSVVLLTTDEATFKERLIRNKSELEDAKYSVKNSLRQQELYEHLICNLLGFILKDLYLCKYHTDNSKSVTTQVSEILNLINEHYKE